MATPKISLDQWTALISVVESGSYAKAAARLHKSQSTLTYAIQKLEELLGVKVFGIQGRKAVLTSTGELLYRRGKVLVEEAARLEHSAGELARGWEPEIRLAVEILFPTWLLLRCAPPPVAARFGHPALGRHRRVAQRAALDGDQQGHVDPRRRDGQRFATLYLIYADRDAAGPGTRLLADIIKREVDKVCREHRPHPLV